MWPPADFVADDRIRRSEDQQADMGRALGQPVTLTAAVVRGFDEWSIETRARRSAWPCEEGGAGCPILRPKDP